MVKPAETHHPQPDKNVAPPEKIIASLFLPEIQAPPSVPQIPFTDEESSPAPLPLTWEETVPSKREWKGILAEAVIWLGALLVIGGSLFLAFQKLYSPSQPLQEAPALVDSEVHTITPKRAPQTPARIPEMMTTERRPSQAPDEPTASVVPTPTQPAPNMVAVHFYSPTMVELTWEAVGENYQYRLYSATTESMSDALSETDEPIRNPHLAWTPRRESAAMWLAVTSIDAYGQESAMGQPKHIRLR